MNDKDIMKAITRIEQDKDFELSDILSTFAVPDCEGKNKTGYYIFYVIKWFSNNYQKTFIYHRKIFISNKTNSITLLDDKKVMEV